MAGDSSRAAALWELPAAYWTVFDDLRGSGPGFDDVDCLVVGPPGIFVVDCRSWSGRVTVRDEVLRRHGLRHDRAITAAADAAHEVAGLMPGLAPSLLHPVLCVLRDQELTGWVGEVMVTSTSTLLPTLLSRPPVLRPDEVGLLSRDLEMRLGLRAGTPAAG